MPARRIPFVVSTAGVSLALLAGASGLRAAPPAAPSPSPAAPVFGQQVDVVSVDVLALDGAGNAVTDLTAADFRIEEEGVPQAISTFEAVRFQESPPSTAVDRVVSSNLAERARPERSFVVIYDDVNLTELGGQKARAELDKLFAALAPGDQVTVIATSGGPWWTARLPEGQPELHAFLDRLPGRKRTDLSAGRISDWEALQIYYARRPDVLGMVARRWYENGLIAEVTPKDASVKRDLELSPGLPLIRAKATEVYQAAAARAVTTVSLIERAVGSLAALRGRKAVLILSEGFLYDSTRPEFRELIRTARDASAVLYYFDARGARGVEVPGNDAEFGRPIEERDRLTVLQNFSRDAEGTESVALDTGGRAVTGTDDLAGAMKKVADESRNYYLLGYVPTNAKKDGKFRNIKVTVSRPGVQVRARKGYYAAGGEKVKKPPPDALDPVVRASLDSPLLADRVPLRLASYVLGSGEGGKATALLVADVDVASVSFEEKGDRKVSALDTFVVVSPLDGGEVRRTEKRLDLSLPGEVLDRLRKQGLPLLRDFELPPGTYQARLLVRDVRGHAMGTVRHTFTVEPPRGLRVSTPILTDTAQNDPAGPIPVPLARRRFAPGARLTYTFDVFGAARAAQGPPRVTVGYVVRRSDGSVFAQSDPRPLGAAPDGSLSHRLLLSLAGASPGDYEVVLTVVDQVSGTKLERRDAFIVSPA
jgi:VWFA-related protein